MQAGHSQVDRVQQRGVALGFGGSQFLLDVLDGLSRSGQHSRLVGKSNYAVIVLRVGISEELLHRLPLDDELVAHTSTQVEHETHRYGSILVGEITHHLPPVVLENTEVFPLQTQDRTVHGIGHRHRDQYPVHVHVQRGRMRQQEATFIRRQRRQGRGLVRTVAWHHMDFIRRLRASGRAPEKDCHTQRNAETSA